MGVVVRFEPELSIYRDKVRLPELPTAKSRDLLEFLVHHRGQRFERRILEDRFWPEADRQRAQTSLRQAVFSIRHTLGDDGPVAANRKHIFCRSSQVTVQEVAHPSQTHPNQDSDYEARLLSSYRSLPLPQTVSKIQYELGHAGLSRGLKFRLRFLLAFSYHELGRTELAFQMIHALVREASSTGEMLIAKHALGALLWHNAEFKKGIETLWEASELAQDQPAEQVHILSNIAIGAYESNSQQELQYAESMAAQKMRLMSDTQHNDVLDYVHGLALTSEHRYSEASQVFESALTKCSPKSHRLSVYLLEANANVKKRKGLDLEAIRLLDQAKAMRKALDMLPSYVELRRLQKLRASLR